MWLNFLFILLIGVMALPKLEITEDGFEKTFQTNHFGHFALKAMLQYLQYFQRVAPHSLMFHLERILLPIEA